MVVHLAVGNFFLKMCRVQRRALNVGWREVWVSKDFSWERVIKQCLNLCRICRRLRWGWWLGLPLFSVDEQMQIKLNVFKDDQYGHRQNFSLQTFKSQDRLLRVADNLPRLRQPSQRWGTVDSGACEEQSCPSISVFCSEPLLFCHIFGLQCIQTGLWGCRSQLTTSLLKSIHCQVLIGHPALEVGRSLSFHFIYSLVTSMLGLLRTWTQFILGQGILTWTFDF